MNHSDHVRLLQNGIASQGETWGDFGSGSGAFTLALAELLGTNGVIYSVDQDASALREQEHAMRERFPATTVHYLRADFTKPLDLPALDGIVMANALHFQNHSNKDTVLRKILEHPRLGGRLIPVDTTSIAETCGFLIQCCT